MPAFFEINRGNFKPRREFLGLRHDVHRLAKH